MKTKTGPARLRQIAEFTILSAAELRQLAAQWEADRAALAMYSKIDGDDGLASANRLLAACERGDGIDQHAAPDIMAARAEIVAQRAALERAANYLMLSEESFVKMRDKRDDVLRELHAKSAALEHANRFLEQETFTRQKYGDQLHATEAALEQARALSEKWAAMKYNGDLTAAVYHGCAEELAALLAAASGGAELDAALSDLHMRPRTGAGGAE